MPPEGDRSGDAQLSDGCFCMCLNGCVRIEQVIQDLAATSIVEPATVGLGEAARGASHQAYAQILLEQSEDAAYGWQ